MKKEFIEVIDKLFSENEIDEEIVEYWNEMKSKKSSGLSENAVKILTFMRDNKEEYLNVFNSKKIGECIGVSSRSVSGSMRGLVEKEYVNKFGSNPVSYGITDAGIAAIA